MPSRVFRCLLHNKLENHSLRKAADHLCWGVYTDGWGPTMQVPSGGTAGVQGESDGVLTGTEGWVKWQIVRDSDAAIRGLVYMYWDNPYFGVTRPKVVLAGRDIAPDCDGDPPPADSSSFADVTGENAPPSDIALSLTATVRDGVPTTIDSVGDLYRVPLAPIFIFGTLGIWERMEVEYELADVSTHQRFPVDGPRTMSLDTEPPAQILSGNWSDSGVRVGIRALATHLFHVKVEDTLQGLNLSTACFLGPSGVAELFDPLSTTRSMAFSRHLRSGASSAHGAVDAVPAGHVAVALAGVSSALRSAVPPALGATESPSALASFSWSAADLIDAVQQLGVARTPALDTIAEAAAAHAAASAYTLFPGSGVWLQLFRETVSGDLRGYKLHYQRIAEDGRVLADAFLTSIPQVN